MVHDARVRSDRGSRTGRLLPRRPSPCTTPIPSSRSTSACRAAWWRCPARGSARRGRPRRPASPAPATISPSSSPSWWRTRCGTGAAGGSACASRPTGGRCGSRSRTVAGRRSPAATRLGRPPRRPRPRAGGRLLEGVGRRGRRPRPDPGLGRGRPLAKLVAQVRPPIRPSEWIDPKRAWPPRQWISRTTPITSSARSSCSISSSWRTWSAEALTSPASASARSGSPMRASRNAGSATARAQRGRPPTAPCRHHRTGLTARPRGAPRPSAPDATRRRSLLPSAATEAAARFGMPVCDDQRRRPRAAVALEAPERAHDAVHQHRAGPDPAAADSRARSASRRRGCGRRARAGRCRTPGGSAPAPACGSGRGASGRSKSSRPRSSRKVRSRGRRRSRTARMPGRRDHAAASAGAAGPNAAR